VNIPAAFLRGRLCGQSLADIHMKKQEFVEPDIDAIETQVRRALDEDVGAGDLTAGLIPASESARATVQARESAVLCGREWFEQTFRLLDPGVTIQWHQLDGENVSKGDTVCELAGPARAMLTGERTALNFLQLLSGTATAAYELTQVIVGTSARLLDTRKTIPGLRLAQKYAVRCGGGTNHRIGLFDAILIKENHIIAAGSIRAAVNEARQAGVMVEVEVENLDELRQALKSGADRAMLDNFPIEDMQRAVEIANGAIELEASGNVDRETIRAIAETGVDYISVGGITKNVRAVDFSMRFQLEKDKS
jgi:nicotinate-nucleotide pyrophosphorylase (carboxylating)